jgi:dihydropteroate synthase
MRARRLSLVCEGDWRRELELVGADPGSWQRLAGKSSVLTIKLFGLSCPMANILKQTMLSAGADAIVTREAVTCRADRSDALVAGTEKAIRRAASSLRGQPFGLPEVGKKLEGLLQGHDLPGRMDLPGGTLDFRKAPLIMGIVNVTPDSFSDGGLHLDADAAAAAVFRMAGEGADIVDLGAESTRPGSRSVPAGEQLARLRPVLEKVAGGPVLSVDTSLPEVAAEAVSRGASVINDVTALSRPELAGIAAEAGAGLVLMHMQGTPEDMQDDPSYRDVLSEVYDFLAERVELAVSHGVPRSRILVDPGIGFGKRLAHNLALIRRLAELRGLGCRVLLGHSRKSFLGMVSGEKDAASRDLHTHAVTALAAGSADVVRVHDVAGTAAVLGVAAAVGGS